jgi:hypothetical protein
VSYKVRWSIAMTALGLSVALLVYVATGSWGWALVGLVGAGVIVNSAVSARAAGRGERRGS